MNPCSSRPLRKPAIEAAFESSDPMLRNPTTGIADCCARATNGHAAAVPPNSAMKLRRLMQNYPLWTNPTKGQRCASQQNWLGSDASGLGRVKTPWQIPDVARLRRDAGFGGFW